MSNRAVVFENFKGTVPVCIELSHSDQVDFGQESIPLFLQLKRFSYLMIEGDKLFRHFERFISSRCSRELVWFSDKRSSVAIRHNFPIGLLYDLHMKRPTRKTTSTTPNSSIWNLIVHFQNFPQDEIVQHRSLEMVELSFMYAVKEANALTHSGSIIQNMSKSDHRTLWTGLCEGDFEKFFQVTESLRKSPVINIPFRLHKSESEIIIQKCIKAYNDTEFRPNTISDLLRFINESQNTKLMLNGIVLINDTPLLWLFQNLSFADNFLHFTLIKDVYDGGR